MSAKEEFAVQIKSLNNFIACYRMKRVLQVLFLIGCVNIAFAQTVFEGIIFDDETNKPVEGISITIDLLKGNKFTSTTGSDGKFRFELKKFDEDRDYRISFKGEGFYNRNGFIKIKAPFYREYKVKRRPIEEAVSDENEILGGGVSLEGYAANNFVFLIDVSGSMKDAKRLPLLKESLKYLVDLYRAEDKIAIVTYATTARLVLPSTSASEKKKIKSVIDRLTTGGVTAGGAGLDKAYKTSKENLLRDGNNKIILATDGAFSPDKKGSVKMEKMIEEGRINDIKLSVLAFGEENEQIKKRLTEMSQIGGGNFTYIQSLKEAKSNLVREAKDE